MLSAPRATEAQSGRIYPLNVHGIVYVTGRELFHLHILQIGAATCGVLFALVVCLHMRRQKQKGKIGGTVGPHMES